MVNISFRRETPSLGAGEACKDKTGTRELGLTDARGGGGQYSWTIAGSSLLVPLTCLPPSPPLIPGVVAPECPKIVH